MFALHRYVVRIYISTELSLEFWQIVEPSAPFKGNYFACNTSSNQGVRSDWVNHNHIRVTMDAYDDPVNLCLNQSDVQLFSFPLSIVGNIRKSNDLFDMQLFEVYYHLNQALSPHSITSVGVKTQPQPLHAPNVQLQGATSNLSDDIFYPLVIEKSKVKLLVGLRPLSRTPSLGSQASFLAIVV